MEKPLTIKQMLEQAKLDRMLEFSKVGPKFKDGLVVGILANDHNIHLYKNDTLIGKFSLPQVCPKKKEDLHWQYKTVVLPRYETDLIDWFSQSAKTYKGKVLNITNFDLLQLTWDQMH